MTSIGLGLAVSLFLGTADFIGGTRARLLPALSVVMSSQAAGLLALLPCLLLVRPPLPEASSAAAAAAAGLAASVGTTALYRGLATGTMSIVAPVSATSALIPVAAGIAAGEALSGGQAAGSLLAIAGVVQVGGASSRRRSAERARPTGIGMALLAALAGGIFIVAMGSVGSDDVLWAATLARLSSLLLIASATRLGPLGTPHAGFVIDRAVLAIGLLEVSSWIMLVVAVEEGLLSIVGVAVSLYPVVTVLLARAIYAERLRGAQAIGVLAVLAGVGLLAAG